MSSLLAPIYTSLTRLYTALYDRAVKLDQLDATTSSRLSSSDARLANLDATIASRVATADTRLATLDAAISSRAAAADYTSGRATKLDHLDAAITSRSTLTAAQVWDYEGPGRPTSRMEVLTSGSTWTPPVGVTRVEVTVLGAGGGGGGGRNALDQSGAATTGGYGGRGGLIFRYPLLVSGPVTYQVGAGGTGGAASVNGSAGGASQFGDLMAPGGNGGTGGTISSYGTNGLSGNAIDSMLLSLPWGAGIYDNTTQHYFWNGTSVQQAIKGIFGTLEVTTALQTPADGATGAIAQPGDNAGAYGCRGGAGGGNKQTLPLAIGGAGGNGGQGAIILEYIA